MIKIVTIKEIAELAGVSRGTVDRVLNNRGTVKEETAERILKIATKLNYTPNRAGKILAAKKKNLKFGAILLDSSSGNPFFMEVARGLGNQLQSLREFGVSVETRFSKIDQPQKQVDLIDELMEQDISGLIIAPINHSLVENRLKKLTKDGFPVVTTNSDIENCGRLAYVGSNYVQGGQTAAAMMNMICKPSPNIGIISGSEWILCHSERVESFLTYAKEHTNMKITDVLFNNDDNFESYSLTQKMLTEHPEIDGLYLVAGGVEGSCNAVKNLGLSKKIKIICHDLTVPTLKFLREDVVTIALGQQASLQGEKPLELLFEYVGMGILPQKEYYTEVEIKIKENSFNR